MFCHIIPVLWNNSRVETYDPSISLWVVLYCRSHHGTEFFVECGKDLEYEFGPVSATTASYIPKLTTQRFIKMLPILVTDVFAVGIVFLTFA